MNKTLKTWKVSNITYTPACDYPGCTNKPVHGLAQCEQIESKTGRVQLETISVDHYCMDHYVQHTGR